MQVKDNKFWNGFVILSCSAILIYFLIEMVVIKNSLGIIVRGLFFGLFIFTIYVVSQIFIHRKVEVKTKCQKQK